MALRTRVRTRTIGGGAAWSLAFPASQAAYDLDFANDQYFGTTMLTGLKQNQTMPATTFAINADGTLTRTSSATQCRRSTLGMWIEDGHTNLCLRNRDGTDAVWTKTNITPTRDQVGADGVSNAAFRIVAGAANGTILQAITDASKARRLTAYAKRIVGTGPVEMTMDNVTWTAITGSLTSAWNRFAIPDQTLANPIIGFRLGTSGDSVAIDLVDLGDNVTNDVSPFAPTTVAVTGIRDRPSTLGASDQALLTYLKGATRCLYWEYAQRQNGALCATDGDFAVSSNSTGVSIGAVITANTPRMSSGFAELVTAPKVNKVMAWRTAGESGVCLNGGTIARGAGGSPDQGATHTDFGTNGAGNLSTLGRIIRLTFFSAVPPDAIIQAFTT